MTVAQIADQIAAYVRETFIADPTANVPLSRSLVEEGIIDSYGIIDIVEFIEREYSVSIPNEDLVRENFGSINMMSAYVQRRLS